MSLRLIVCGSRNWIDRDMVWAVLDGLWIQATNGHLMTEVSSFTLFEGGADGADYCARLWAKQAPTHSYNEKSDDPAFTHYRCDADWEALGKRAGPARNAEMLEALVADPLEPKLVVAFKEDFDHDLKKGGTEDCVRQARALGVPVRIIQ